MTVQIYVLFSNPPNNRQVFCSFMFNSTLLGYMSSFFSKLLRLVFVSLPPNIIFIFMEEEKPKKKRKRKAAEDSGEKGHKKNWREVYATPSEIKMFLNDPTGNRRWLPFEVESISNPRENPFNYEGIYAQAYALYRQGYRHYFSKEEEEVLKEHNKTFETPSPEQEAISKHFHKPKDGEKGDFYTATDILEKINCSPALRMTVEKIGSAMKALGYRRYFSHGRRGYRVVPYKSEEIEMNRRMLAYDAQPGAGFFRGGREHQWRRWVFDRLRHRRFRHQHWWRR